MLKNKYACLLVAIFLIQSLGLTGCGADSAMDEQGASADIGAEEVARESSKNREEQEASIESEDDLTGQDAQEDPGTPETEPGLKTSVASAEEGANIYDFGPVTYDLSAVPDMENRLYAEWDGSIYFRQYSDEDIEKGALWANFGDIPDTEKELMCLAPDGELIQVGTDYGCGAIYIVNGRLYSQCRKYADPDNKEESACYYVVYSCELDGSDIKEYASSRVMTVKGGNIICVGDYEKPGLTIIDGYTGQEHILVDEAVFYLDATEKEVFFFRQPRIDDESFVYDTVLYSVDYNGRVRELATFTVEECAEMLGEDPEYMSSIQIPYFKIWGNDIYLSAGWYAGSGNMYQGGAIYSMKKDGSECKVEALSYDDIFYLYDDGINRALLCSTIDEKSGRVAENGRMLPISLIGQAPQNITLRPAYGYPYDEAYVYSSTAYDPLDHSVYPDTSVLLYPDTSGICYVLLTEQDCEGLSVDAYVDGSLNQDIKDIEYLDGKLFFTVTDLTYNPEESVGWRDGYDRGRTACYCKDMKNGEIRLLYEY